MLRSVPRRLLTDAALALALIVLTIGPRLLTGLVAIRKPGDTQRFLGGAGLPTDTGWWVLAGLIVAGLLIRQPSPLVALVLVGAGTFGHLLM